MLNFADAAILDITVSPYPVSSAANGLKAGTIPNYAPDIVTSIVVMVVYAVIALVLTYFFFKRREMSA